MAFANGDSQCLDDRHYPGCPEHTTHMYKGKPWHVADYKQELATAKLVVFRQELKDDQQAGRKPPGVPKVVHGCTVYPARNFA